MLIVTQLPDKRLSIKCDYYYRNRIHNIPTAYFDPNNKQWIIESFMLGTLEKEFDGELVYKTPRWVILNEPMPDMSKMYQIKDKSIKAPTLKLKPYDYQDYGIRFMIDKLLQHNMVFNADSVGTGKTIQSIGVIKWFIENKGLKKFLIICKKSIKRQWRNEFLKFTDLDKTFNIIYTGDTSAQRKKAYKEFDNSQQGILITNYHSFLNDTSLFNQMNIDMVIIDEAHSVKARTGKLNNNIASVIQGKPTVFLTGTPIMSRPEDIFGIVQMSNPNYFGKWSIFSKQYLVYTNGAFGWKLVGCKNLNELRDKVQDILIRRTEYEISIQMPKTNIIKRLCEMDDTQAKLLEAIKSEQRDIMDSMKKFQTADGKITNMKAWMALDAQSKALIAARQAASTDPRMFLMSNSKIMHDHFGQLIPSSYKGSSKTETLLDLVDDIVQAGNKVILFSKFRTSVLLAADDIKNHLKENVLLYTGFESGDVRDNNIDTFTNSQDYNILLGTDAMAEGLNLQAAKYIINIDQPDTYAIKTQRIGRIRRASSAFDNVIIYDLITENRGNIISKDEERLNNIEKNKDLNDALISIDESQRQALINTMKGNEENE